MLQEDVVLPRATKPPFLSALHAKNGTTNLFGHKLDESTESNKAILFFLGKETIQTFNHYAVVCEVINLLVAIFKNSAMIYF